MFLSAGFVTETLTRGRNARTNHPATLVLTFRATKPRASMVEHNP